MRTINLCKLNSKRAGQAGFSLVELMVVVAIIGILATVAIPNVSKFMNKARSSEAKAMLGSLYTSEKAFFAEWNSYHDMLGAVGFAPEGTIRYNVGFNGTASPTINNFTVPGSTTAQAKLDTYNYCKIATTTCTMHTASTATDVPPSSAVAATTFTAGAIASLPGGIGKDSWTINELKVLSNTVPGI